MDITMTNMKRTAGLILLFLCLSLPGCFSLNKGAPVQQHYVLGAGPRVASVAAAVRVGVDPDSVGVPVIGLRPSDVADYLAHPWIVVRRGVHQIGFSEFHRWGEDLARGIDRTLTGHLAGRLPESRVEVAPWPMGVRPERLIEVTLLRFEGVAPEDPLATVGEAHLLATWEILDAEGRSRLVSGTTDVRSSGWTVGEFDDLVGLLDAALAVLAEDLVRGLERVPPGADGLDPL